MTSLAATAVDRFRNIGGDAGGGGGDGQAGDASAFKGADELDLVSGETVPGHLDIACADGSEGLEGAGHFGEDGAVRVRGGEGDGLVFPAKAEGHGAERVLVDAEIINGVFNGGGTLDGGNFNAEVQLHFHGVGFEDKAVDTGEGCAAGIALKGGELAGRVRAVGHQGEAESDLGKIEPEFVGRTSVETGERRHFGSADAEVVDIDLFPVGEGHTFDGLDECKVAADGEEVEKVDVNGGGGLDVIALAAVHFQGDGLPRAVGHFERLGLVVDDILVVVGGLVDGHLDVAGRHGEAVDAGKVGAFGGGFEADPTALPFLFINKGEGETGTFDFKAECVGSSAVHPDKGIDVGTADSEEIDRDILIVGQGHAALVFLKGKAALDAEEVVEVEVDIAAGLDDGTFLAVHGEGNAGGRADGDFEVVSEVVHQRAVVGRPVNLNSEVGGGQGNPRYPDKGCPAGCCVEGSVAAGFVRLVCHQREGKIDIGKGDPEGIRLATVHAEEGIKVLRTDGEEVGGNDGTVVEGDLLGALLKGEPTGGREEIVEGEFDVATGADEFAVTGQHVESDGVGNADLDVESVGLVIDQRAVGGSHIDVHREGVPGNGDTLDAVK